MLPRRTLGYVALTGDAEGEGSGLVDVERVLIARSLRRRWLPPSFLARDLANRRPHLDVTDQGGRSVIDKCAGR